MEIGFVGLGKMGLNMVTRLQRAGHQVTAYDRSVDVLANATAAGCIAAASLADLVQRLKGPRAVWIMVPSGAPTEETVQAVSALQAGDIIIDGGNTRFHDDVRRAAELKKKGIQYIDAGTSGGVWGLKVGYCLMVGGEKAAVTRLAPSSRPWRREQGWAHMGGAGAGHYVKMVHNGIEYSMMQGYAEGFELMSKSEYSWISLGSPTCGCTAASCVPGCWNWRPVPQGRPETGKIKGYVQDSGEGRWMIADAIEKDVPVPTLTSALFTRFRSRQQESFAEKMLAALRNAFGGHSVRR